MADNITDDAIRETHGMACRKIAAGGAEKPSAIVLWENHSHVFLNGCYEDRALTIRQARYLARKLYRLARRIEKRQSDG